jgi:putative transposase
LNLELMRIVDEQYLKTPFYGNRRMTEMLRRQGYIINRKRVARLMQQLGLVAIAPSPQTSTGSKEHKKYPYLLKNLEINQCNQVWAADITYVPVDEGYLYLVAVLDWYSRFILSWRLSNSLESDFCVEALKEAFQYGHPSIFNTDQGVQFTSDRFTEELDARAIQISMDGKGHYWDNIIVERLWRSVKYEEVYLKNYQSAEEAYEGLSCYTQFYNYERLHQALGYKPPVEIYKKEVA